MEQFLFFFIALVAVASAVYFVFARNPLYAILSLIVTFFSIAALYVLLNAQFLGIVQIIVYTGAIMVLFLYVLMMLNLNAKDESKKQNLTKFIGIFSAGILFVESCEQREHRGFPCSGGAHEGHRLSGLGCDRDPVQGGLILIGERYVFESNFAADPCYDLFSVRGIRFLIRIKDLEDPVGGGLA